MTAQIPAAIGTAMAGGIGIVLENARPLPGFLEFFGLATPVLDANNQQLVEAGMPVFGEAADYGFLTVCSMMAWCLGYFGMPQVLLRFMAIRKEEEPNRSRRIANDSVHCSSSPRTLRRLRIITNEYRAAAAPYFC